MKYKFSSQGYTWLMRGLILHILLFFSVLSFANIFTTTGQSLLQRKISLRVENLDVKAVLKIIESKDTVRFAYQSQAMNMNRRVSLKVKDAPSISKVSSNDIGTQVVSNPADVLSGLSSGVQEQAACGGYPGATPVIGIFRAGTGRKCYGVTAVLSNDYD